VLKQYIPTISYFRSAKLSIFTFIIIIIIIIIMLHYISCDDCNSTSMWYL